MSFAEHQLDTANDSGLVRVAPPVLAAAGSVLELSRRALAEPIGQVDLRELQRGAQRIAVIVSDATRHEPRAEMLEALRELLPWQRVRLVIATGTHGATAALAPADVGAAVVHDATRTDDLRDLGETRQGTKVRLNEAVAGADLVIVTGRVRPHYFAGFSGGLKGLFPGCAAHQDILDNHQLKADPSARLGRLEDNRCRLDMEQAALAVPGAVAILNVLADVEGHPVAAVAGHPVLAHRELCRRARGVFTVRAPRGPIVVVADRPPVTSTLYQASKLLPPAGALLEEGGTVIVVADCDGGTGPLERVNEGIYRLGVSRQLAPRHRVVLVSQLPAEVVRTTYATPAENLAEALRAARAEHGGAPVPVLWRAGECLVEVRS